MTQLALNPPLWAPVLVAVVGLGVLLQGGFAGRRRVLGAGGVLLGLAAVWLVLAWLVPTDLKTAEARTRRVAEAVNKQDWKAMADAMDDVSSFEIYNNRRQLVAGAQMTAASIGLKSVRITSLTAEQKGSFITVDVDCWSVQDVTMDQPVPTAWRFNYSRTRDGLVLESIDILDNGRVRPDDVRAQLRKVRPLSH